jgi:hypothetical protein
MNSIKLFNKTFSVTRTTAAGTVVFEDGEVKGHMLNGIAFLTGAAATIARLIEGREESVYIVSLQERELGEYVQLYVNV